jgi:hypothetical protein
MMTTRRMFAAVPVGFFCLITTPSIAADDAPPEVDCGHIWDKPALLADHEACALKTTHSVAEYQEHITKKVWGHTYRATVKNIPATEPALKKRAADVLQASDEDQVVIVAPQRVEWATRMSTPKQGFGGGGVKGQLVMLCLLGKTVDGHYETTQGALKGSGLSGPGINFVARAAREADRYEWDTAAAHGQTGNPEKGDVVAPLDPATAKNDYRDYIRLQATRVIGACAKGDAVEAGYVLGYLFHAVQDLSTHQGITNAEHSYLSYLNKNPDAVEESLIRAKRWSIETLIALRPKLRSDCLEKMAQVPSDQPPPPIVTAYYGGEDGDYRALWKYRNLGPKFDEAVRNGRKGLSTPWFDGEGADAFFWNNVAASISGVR